MNPHEPTESPGYDPPAKAETAPVQHHWHEPTQGQVIKAMYQVLQDRGVTKGYLEGIVQSKIDAAVQAAVQRAFDGGKLDKMLLDAVTKFLATAKKGYEENRHYSWTDHLRDLVYQELRRAVTDDYQVTVAKKERGLDGAKLDPTALVEKAVRT